MENLRDSPVLLRNRKGTKSVLCRVWLTKRTEWSSARPFSTLDTGLGSSGCLATTREGGGGEMRFVLVYCMHFKHGQNKSIKAFAIYKQPAPITNVSEIIMTNPLSFSVRCY